MLHMSVDEYKMLCKKAKTQHVQWDSPSNLQNEGRDSPKTPKHRNIKVYVYEDGLVSTEKLEGHGGIREKYDSKKEYQRGCDLQLLEKAKRISNLQRQTVLLISPAFVDKDGEKHRAITYCADFTYVENGREIVEDVKGFSREKGRFLCTEAFRLKWKMLQSLYPEKTFRLY